MEPEHTATSLCNATMTKEADFVEGQMRKTKAAFDLSTIALKNGDM